MIKKLLISFGCLALLSSFAFAYEEVAPDPASLTSVTAHNVVVAQDTTTIRTDLSAETLSRTTQGLYRYSGVKTMPTYSQTGDTTVNVKGDGQYSAFTNATAFTGIVGFTCAETTFTLTNELQDYYIYADYNNGSPLLKMSTDNNDINTLTTIAVLSTIRIDDDMDFLEWRLSGNGVPEKLTDRFVRTSRFERERTGLILDVTASSITCSAAYVWHGNVREYYDSFNAHTDTLTCMRHSNSVWVAETKTNIGTNSYDNGITTVALTAGTYGFSDFWRCMAEENELYSVKSSTGYVTLLEAQSADIRSDLPQRVISMGLYVGRIIYGAGTTTGWTVRSAFLTSAAGSASVTAHNNLTGIDGGQSGEYYHLTHAEHDNALQVSIDTASINSDLQANKVVVGLTTATLRTDLSTETTNRTNQDLAIGLTTGTLRTDITAIQGVDVNIGSSTATLRTDLTAVSLATGTNRTSITALQNMDVTIGLTTATLRTDLTTLQNSTITVVSGSGGISITGTGTAKTFNVIASSIAVNAVYPSAVRDGTYSMTAGSATIALNVGSLGLTFPNASNQTVAWAPVITSSIAVTHARAVNVLTDVFISTITHTQIGGKKLAVSGDVTISTTRNTTFDIALYRDVTLLRDLTVVQLANTTINYPVNWFSSSSTAGSLTYTIRVHANENNATKTLTSYAWQVSEN